MSKTSGTKFIIVSVLILALLTSCTFGTMEEASKIVIESSALFKDSRVNSHVDYQGSSMFDIVYRGDNVLDIYLEVWEDGVFSELIPLTMEGERGSYNGISVTARKIEDEDIELTIGIHNNSASTILKRNIKIGEAIATVSIEEEKKTFGHENKIYLWAMVANSGEAVRMSLDEKLFENSGYSVALILIPSPY